MIRVLFLLIVSLVLVMSGEAQAVETGRVQLAAIENARPQNLFPPLQEERSERVYFGGTVPFGNGVMVSVEASYQMLPNMSLDEEIILLIPAKYPYHNYSVTGLFINDLLLSAEVCGEDPSVTCDLLWTTDNITIREYGEVELKYVFSLLIADLRKAFLGR